MTDITLRFRAQFRNGYHQVFDTVFYAPVQTHRLAKDAQRAAANLNARHAGRKGGRRA